MCFAPLLLICSLHLRVPHGRACLGATCLAADLVLHHSATPALVLGHMHGFRREGHAAVWFTITSAMSPHPWPQVSRCLPRLSQLRELMGSCRPYGLEDEAGEDMEVDGQLQRGRGSGKGFTTEQLLALVQVGLCHWTSYCQVTCLRDCKHNCDSDIGWVKRPAKTVLGPRESGSGGALICAHMWSSSNPLPASQPLHLTPTPYPSPPSHSHRTPPQPHATPHQASRHELLLELQSLRAVQLAGRWRLVDEDYLGRLLEVLLLRWAGGRRSNP